MIKFLDIYKQDKIILNKIYSDIKKIIKKNNFILGEEVIKFEKEFSNFCGSKYAISCGNGTDALTIALKILNLPKNSEVLIPAMTYCSTAFAVINANLKPVLIDLKENEPTLNIELIKRKITSKTKVIMPVHLYGSVVNLRLIKNIIKRKKIIIIDDCSQAHGAKLNNRKVGSLADISCFSLYPGKNLGAYGDAGIITTNSKFFYKKIKNFRNLGSVVKFKHTQVGVNSRMDTIQAAILSRKLTQLNFLNNKRKKIAKFYNKMINNKNIVKLNYSKGAVYHQYVILTKKRNQLIKIFNSNKIQYGFHYPKTINQLECFKKNFKLQKFPNSEKISKQGLSLPINPHLSILEIKKITQIINSIK